MTSFWGNHIKLSIFGESHGTAIGAVLDGLPSGVPLDLDAIAGEMDRRSARGKALATPRKEADAPEIVSGFFEGRTTGTPLTGIIYNQNTKSKDYTLTKNKMRPGHADYTAYLRYGGFQDYRGGGHFSGRLTAPMVFAGAVAKQVLYKINPDIKIRSRIVSIGSVFDDRHLTPRDYENMPELNDNFPLYHNELGPAMLAEIEKARKNKDSVGGIIEGFVTGLPGGLGDPIFESVESRLSSLLFSIPAVKGVSFGSGFDIAEMKGSEANDSFFMEGDRVETRTNHNGGINGGITNGMPVVFQTAFKPTPSIAQKQRTIDILEMKDTELEIVGRHDPCIVLRAAPVVEAVTALGILDLILSDAV